MMQNLKDLFFKSFKGEGKKYVEDYRKIELECCFGGFIIVVYFVLVLLLDKNYSISGILGGPFESIYNEER